MAELIIVFREVLEGSLIVGILYTYLKKTNQPAAILKLWQGVAAALIVSVLGSFIFQIFADGFEGRAGKLLEGIIMIIAAAVLGSMIVWMAKNRNIADDLKDKANEALSGENVGYGIFALAFVSGFREGIETILFLYGIIIIEGGLNIVLSLVGAALGIGLSFTKARGYEGIGASKIGSIFIYILVATIGMKMDLTSIFDEPKLILIGLIWISIHAILLVVVAKLIHAPYFFLAVGSQANVGGAASAPVVAAAFSWNKSDLNYLDGKKAQKQIIYDNFQENLGGLIVRLCLRDKYPDNFIEKYLEYGFYYRKYQGEIKNRYSSPYLPYFLLT